MNASNHLHAESSDFSENHAKGGQGGALMAWAFNFIELHNITMAKNSARSREGVVSSFVDPTKDSALDVTGTEGGGAIAMIFGNMLNLMDSTISKNRVLGQGGGGGISVVQSNAVTLMRSTFSFNTASEVGGGALWSGVLQNFKLQDCTFIKNVAEQGDGGAVVLGSFTTLSLIFNCTFIGNTAMQGSCGAMSISSQSAGSLGALTFTSNKAALQGGGVCLFETVRMSILRSTFIDNSVGESLESGNGGAVYLNKDIGTTIDNCDFLGNKAMLGSAIFVDLPSPFPVTISNNLFYNNSASGGGTVMWLNASQPSNSTSKDSQRVSVAALGQQPINLTLLAPTLSAHELETQLSQLSSAVLPLHQVCPAYAFNSTVNWQIGGPYPPAINCSIPTGVGPIRIGGREECDFNTSVNNAYSLRELLVDSETGTVYGNKWDDSLEGIMCSSYDKYYFPIHAILPYPTRNDYALVRQCTYPLGDTLICNVPPTIVRGYQFVRPDRVGGG